MARREGENPNYQLTAQQLTALDLLLSGRTVTDTAAELSIARETVSRWRNTDAGFQAAYNAAAQSLWDAGQQLLLDARARAIAKLADLVDHADPAIALKAAAALARVDIPRPRGDLDPASIDRLSRLRGVL